MSRLIVKNLPESIKEKNLRQIFEKYGTITDLQLKHTKSGVFRRFAFIGYKTEEEAKATIENLNNTYIQTYKIQIDVCKNLYDSAKPRPWKHLIQEIQKGRTSTKKEDSKKNENSAKSKHKSDIPEELKNDQQFKEFLAVHSDRKSKPIWSDDIGEFQDAETCPDVYEDNDNKNCVEEEKEHDELEKQIQSSPTNKTSSPAKQLDDSFTVKLSDLPYSCKKNMVKEFFRPLKIVSLRFPPKFKGFAFVRFSSEKDMNKALNKNRSFLGGRKVKVVKYVKKQLEDETKNKSGQIQEDMENNEELVETGRIYVRNLCYSVTEADIEQLFSKYGPLAEMTLPIDLLTKRALGYAFVTYVFAEHAVKAFSELDGIIFQGRMLHLIPGHPKKEYTVDENETNYKKKKETDMKKLGESPHNWNILFLNMNAVADVIAEKYNVEKSQLLSGDTKESVAVRMALAESQMVLETRKFLIDKGVELDAFSQPAAERSKTVIIVKHLPAKTTAEEINEVFSKHGTVSRVIVPPSGIVAIVEFQDPTEAKSAFKKLAYTRFHHLPLYLEWAPVNAIKEKPADEEASESTEEKKEEKEADTQVPEDNDSYEDEPLPETTVFVKNLNFKTTQEAFKKHFEQCGPINYATISTKKDIKTGKKLSMGFGFVQFKNKESAVKAIQNLQLSKLDDHALKVKFVNRASVPVSLKQRQKAQVTKQHSAKIIVKNIPFEASEKEVRDLFKEFGILKAVRLPKKIGNEGHRGFGFIEYITKSDAKRAFEALCHSTHLFGRRLALQWAKPEEDDVRELRKKTAKDFLGSGPKTKLSKKKLNEDVILASVRSQSEDV